MKKKLTIGLAAIVAASTALGICYKPAKVPCGAIVASCPDGTIGLGIQCDTQDQKDLNTMTGTGYYLTNTSGICTYNCWYPSGTNQVGCGSITNKWNGSKPNDVHCPSSGS